MARLTEDDFAALQGDLQRDTDRALGGLRRASGAQQNERTEAWLSAGDTLAEKAVAALDTGDDDRAAVLVRRIVGLPEVDDGLRAGLLAVDLVLYNELLDPVVEDAAAPGLLDAPLRLLPQLDAPVAAELRRVLASLTEYGLPDAVIRRIHAVVEPERRLDPPFAAVPEEALPQAVTGVLQLILRLRTGG